MKIRKGFWKNFLIACIAYLVVVGLFTVYRKYKTQNETAQPQKNGPVTPLPAFKVVGDVLPEANWTKPTEEGSSTVYGSVLGQEKIGQVTSSVASIPHFEDVSALANAGYRTDSNFAADGPGSSTWGYKKTVGDKVEIILFSYDTVPASSNPNEPISFSCPCKVNVSIFATKPFVPQSN